MKWIRQHRVFLILSAATIGCTVMGWLLYFIFGQEGVELTHQTTLDRVLDRLLERQQRESVQHYQKVVGNLISLGIPTLIAILGLSYSIAFSIHQARLNRKTVQLLILGLAFLLSVFVRLPHMDRRLCDHHEWLTAQSLIALDNLDSQGAWTHRFRILQSYPLETDKFVQTAPRGVMDNEGNTYYVSFPPLAIILPFILFKSLWLPFTVWNLQLFNLAVHVISTFFIFCTIWIVLPETQQKKVAALVGGCVYIFIAPNLWYYSNVYSWDTLWHAFWCAGLYYVVRTWKNIQQGLSPTWPLFKLGIVTVLTTYTDYHGVLFSISVICLAVTNRRRSRHYLAIIWTMIGASTVALLVSLWQYSSIAGLHAFLDHLFNLGLHRSFLSDFNYLLIGRHYAAGFFYLLVPVALLVGLWLKHGIKNALTIFGHEEKIVLFLSLVPVLTHHILMMQWTAIHDYSVVKTSVFVTFFIALLFDKICFRLPVKRAVIVLVFASVIHSLVLSAGWYSWHFAYAVAPDRYYEAGMVVRTQARPEEVIFAVSQRQAEPQLIYYSGRNIQRVKDRSEAVEWLIRHRRNRGVIFYIDGSLRILKFERLSS